MAAGQREEEKGGLFGKKQHGGRIIIEHLSYIKLVLTVLFKPPDPMKCFFWSLSHFDTINTNYSPKPQEEYILWLPLHHSSPGFSVSSQSHLAAHPPLTYHSQLLTKSWHFCLLHMLKSIHSSPSPMSALLVYANITIPFIQHIFPEYLLWAYHCSRSWGLYHIQID